MKKISIKINNEETKIIFTYGDENSLKVNEIFIEQENEDNLNEIYDYIIQNIKEIEIDDEIDNEKKDTKYLAAKKIVELLNSEIEAIKKESESYALIEKNI